MFLRKRLFMYFCHSFDLLFEKPQHNYFDHKRLFDL